jgi:hypothetical protein
MPLLAHLVAPMGLALAPHLAIPPAVCASNAPASLKGAHLFIEVAKPAPTDSVITARLCLAPPRAGVGSYMATLTFDSTLMRVIQVNVIGGLQVKNAEVPGAIRLAGAAPTGFARGPLATIVFKPRRGKALSKVKLTLLEANTPAGASVLAGSSVQGHPATDRTLGIVQTAPGKSGPVVSTAAAAAPRIDSISPKSARIEAEGVIDLALYGSGFSPAGNTVLFDAATLEGMLSESGGTIIRFVAPGKIPAHGTLPSRRVVAGTYSVRVRTAAGTSNAVTFTARGEDR